MQEKIVGLVAAPFTAFDTKGQLDLTRIEAQAADLIRQGVAGAFIGGTTGEGASLSTEERLALTERWMQVAGRDLAIIVHVGHNSLVDARALAAHAQQAGARAFAALAPNFFRPGHPEDLVRWCARIAEAAPQLPFYYYHIPAMTGVSFPMADWLETAGDRIENLAGIKFTCENLMDYQQALAYAGGRFDLLFGRDEMLLSALAVGACGAVGSTYNYAAPLYLQMIDCFHRGDLVGARSFQHRASEVIRLMIRHGGLPAGKAIMALIGVACGPVRLPLRDLEPAQRERLRDALDAIGFFDALQCSDVGRT